MSTTHQIKVAQQQGEHFKAFVNDYEFSISGDANIAGARPKPLLLASLAGCTGIDVVSLLAKMRVQYSDFSLDVSADLTEEHPKVYSVIYLTYNIKVNDSDKDKVEKAVKLSEEKYCGVSAMLIKNCPIHVKINYL
ncbi:MAG: OsmC family protein [Bacteroidia bacterium]